MSNFIPIAKSTPITSTLNPPGDTCIPASPTHEAHSKLSPITAQVVQFSPPTPPTSGKTLAAQAPTAICTRAGQHKADPISYNHPYESMRRYSELLALRYDCQRTRHANYRKLRLLHEHFQTDPEALTEENLHDYFIFLKTRKQWKPQSIRQAAACFRLFFCELLAFQPCRVFSHLRNRDAKSLPTLPWLPSA